MTKGAGLPAKVLNFFRITPETTTAATPMKKADRATSGEFPNTIPGVIFDQKNGVQFEPVSNGTVFRSPAALSVSAAKQVLNGEVILEDALYFYAPALSQGIWINANRTYYTTIGCHRFYL